MRLLLVNQPLNNRGDEAAHRALVRGLLAAVPSVEIRVLFLGVDGDSIRQFTVDDPRVRYVHIYPERGSVRLMKAGIQTGCHFLFSWLPSVRRMSDHYRWSERVLCAPGGICMGGFQNWMHLFFLQLAVLTEKPLDYFGRSIGPFPEKSWLNRRFSAVSRRLLSYCSFVSLRDTQSVAYAGEWGIQVVPTVDTAFLDQPLAEIPEAVSDQIGSDYVIFVPNLLIWHYSFRDRMTRDQVCDLFQSAAERLESRFPASRIVFLPQTFNYGNDWDDDRGFFQDIAARGETGRRIVLPDTLGADIQQQIVRQARYVVGARYHSIVFAINNETPFLALCYEHKISGMLERLGYADRMVDIRSLGTATSGEAFLSEMERLLEADLPSVRRDEAAGICRKAFEMYLKSLC